MAERQTTLGERVTLVASVLAIAVSIASAVWSQAVVATRVDEHDKKIERIESRVELVATKDDVRRIEERLETMNALILQIAGVGR